MSRILKAPLWAISALLLIVVPALPATNGLGVEIDNFGKINSNYYRGAQPDRAGIEGLKRLGVKTIIDLQEKGKREESEWVRAAGLRFFKIALSSTRPATGDETAYFLKLVNDPANWPVYVHCAGGRHRTGMMTAIYRITHDRWNADKAFEEMKQFKYYAFGGHGSLRDYVYNFFRDFSLAFSATPAAAEAH
jgi:tyrosine-protein phosphatase SIW14